MGRIRLAFFILFLAPLGCKPSPTAIATKKSEVKKPPGAAPVRLSAAAVAAPPIIGHAPPRVIIVGGGLAGLVAAYELDKRGIPFHILEASNLFGGRVATAEYEGGAIAESGLQEMWQGNPLLNVVDELELPLDEHPEPAYSSVVIGGKLYPYTQESRDAYLDSLLPADEKARFLEWLDTARRLREAAEREGLQNAEVNSLQPISFAAWVKSANLPHTASELVRLLIECELATDWQNFSALFGLLEFGEFLGDGQTSRHVRGGNSRLIDAIVHTLHGNKTLSALVTRIERWQRDSGEIGVRVHYQRGRHMESIEAERVVLAVPFWRLHQIEVIPPLSSDKWQAVQSLGRGQYTVVHMLMSPPKDIRQLWLLNGHNPFSVLTDGPLGVIYGVGKAPQASDGEAFSLLVHGQDAAAFHMVPREIRLHEIYGELEKLWPGFTQFVKSSFVYTYHPGAVAVWPPGRSPLDELSQKLRQPELGLYLAGDYLYNAHSDGAAKSGISAAERIAAEFGITKPPRPALLKRRLELHPAAPDSKAVAPPRPLPALPKAPRHGSSAAPENG